jgi:hypothetical protein
LTNSDHEEYQPGLLEEVFNEAVSMNKMVQAVDKYPTDFPSVNQIELHYYVLYHLNFRHLHSTFLKDFVLANRQNSPYGL